MVYMNVRGVGGGGKGVCVIFVITMLVEWFVVLTFETVNSLLQS